MTFAIQLFLIALYLGMGLVMGIAAGIGILLLILDALALGGRILSRASKNKDAQP